MSDQAQNLIAVPGVAHDSTGSIVWWTLSGTVNAEELREKLEEVGYDAGSLLHPPSPATALQRAVKEQQSRHRLVRKQPDGSWAIVDESWDAALDASYAVDCTMSVDKVGHLSIDPPEHPLAVPVIDAYACNLEELSATDVSNWLVHLAKVHHGVPLRESGGIYFVPKDYAKSWSEIVGKLMCMSSSIVYNIPAMSGEDAALAVIDALSRDVKTQVFALGRGEPGKRALKNRMRDCGSLQEKVEKYEQLFGKSLGTLHESLGDLEAGLAMSLLKAEAD